MDLPLLDEIEVVCSQCSFPTVTEYDDEGKVLAFREEDAPKTEDDALAAGWTDSGLGLLCPPCSAKAVEEAKLAEAQGETTGAGGVPKETLRKVESETTYYGMLKSMHPEVSEGTIGVFVEILKLNDSGDLDEISERLPQPVDEAQALEFLEVAETVKKAMVKK